MRHLEIQPQQIPNLLEQGYNLRVKIHSQLETPSSETDDFEQTTVDAHVSSVDIVEPGFKDWSGVQLFAEGGGFGLEFLAFGVEFPTFTEDIFDSFHVGEQLSFDLAGPDYGACDWWEVSHLRHVEGFRVSVLGFELGKIAVS
jgi:hypothetical protein